ncbi:Wzy polymerase domain-containing protein [Pseudomonas sp. SG20056]|uniref:PglL family O-oligosaccharyltransferase n=1 Tax=Pseudomonas sp. SG20056 TaxID=3074146 RepID=UPI00287FD88D|nr:Wzy polymerase domain-containing protein [Pseudomonas sp. SG20056]WNF46148.1 Wzy polymerase domain-containing protein [Pseudomonas sp. SG20056]
MRSKVKYQGLMLLACGVFVFAWLMPNHNPPWTSAYQEFASFFAGLMLLSVVVLSRQIKVTPAVVGFFMLASVPLLQWWVGVVFFSSDAWIISIFISGFALMLMVGYSLGLQSESRLFFARLLAATLIVGAVLSLWIALRQWLLFPSGSFWVIDLPRGGRPYANLAQPNSLATLLCMGLAGVLYLYERYIVGRFTAGLLAVCLLFGVTLTMSRTPWVASIAVLAFWCWKAYGGALRLSIVALLGWLGFYVLCLLVLPSIADALLLAESDPLARTGSSARLDIWWQLWQAVLQGPIWGYGWGQVGVAQVSVALEYPVPRLMTFYSHNILLDLLLWNGPILGGVIIFCVAVWLWRIGRSAASPESLFALVASGCVLVHAMLEYPLAYAFFLLPLGLLLGLAAAERRAVYELNAPVWLCGGVLVFSVSLLGWYWKEYRVIDEYYRVSRLEEAGIVGAVAGNVPNVVLLSQPREYIRLVREWPVAGMSGSQLDAMRKVSYRYPGALSLFRYAFALGINDRPSDAYEQLRVIRAQFGERVYLQALQEFQRKEAEYPQLAAVRLGLTNSEF